MRYYSHHLGDYLRDTMHLSILQDGAYRRLLDSYYMREEPLPKDLKTVYRLVRAESKQDKAAVLAMLKAFFKLTDSGWHHARCDREISAARRRIITAIENGKRGGRRPKQEGTQQEPSGLADQYPTLTERASSPFPIPQYKEKESETKNGLAERRAELERFVADTSRHSPAQRQRILASKT